MHRRVPGRLLTTIGGVRTLLRGNWRTHSDGHVRELASLRFRLGGILLLRECLRLLVRLDDDLGDGRGRLATVFRIEASMLLWGLLGWLAVAAASVILARRKIPSIAALRAVLDRHGRLGGLLMAAGIPTSAYGHEQIRQRAAAGVEVAVRSGSGCCY